MPVRAQHRSHPAQAAAPPAHAVQKVGAARGDSGLNTAQQLTLGEQHPCYCRSCSRHPPAGVGASCGRDFPAAALGSTAQPRPDPAHAPRPQRCRAGLGARRPGMQVRYANEAVGGAPSRPRPLRPRRGAMQISMQIRGAGLQPRGARGGRGLPRRGGALYADEGGVASALCR